MVVVVDKEPNRDDIVVGEGEGFANKSGAALAQSIVKTFDALSPFALAMMALSGYNCLIGPKQVGVALGV